MTSFIFMRHGRSQANKDGVVADALSPLTKEGQAQARKAARTLKGSGVVTIVCSPFGRARDTADIIARQLHIDTVIPLDDLRERGLGEFEGKPKEHESEWYFTVDYQAGVEPIDQLMARLLRALNTVKELSKHGTVLVVGHAVSGFYLQQIAAGRLRPADIEPPRESQNAQAVEVPILFAPKTIILPFTRMQAVAIIVALVVIGLVTVWVLWPQPPPPTPRSQPDIPMSVDDFKESPNLQGAIQKQLQQQNSNEQPQVNALQQTAPNLQAP